MHDDTATSVTCPVEVPPPSPDGLELDDTSTLHACRGETAPSPSLVGHKLGRFTVLEGLGHGGMGSVYAAYDPSLDRRVAIKVLHSNRIDDVNQRRLWREAQALAQLSHPNVVTVHDVGRSNDGAVFVAMEFVNGRSLAAWQRSKPGTAAVLASYVRAGRGLAAAHEAGLVHRDFKPSNVMRTAGGEVKVLDFGLARQTTDSQESSELGSVREERSSFLSSLTRAGTVMGTPAYMSPEQHCGSDTDARTDQYGFCVALWEGLTGRRPFSGTDFADLLRAKEQGPPSWPRGAVALPRAVVEAIQRGLSVDPEQRWPSMQALIEQLQWDTSRRRRRWMVGLGGLVVASLGAASTYSLVHSRAARCDGAEAKLAGVWDDDRRSETKAAMLATGRPYATQVWTRTEQELDDYAASWATMHSEACEATAVRHEQSPAALDLRMRCLHRASVDLAAAVDILAGADGTVVDEAHAIMAGLRPLSRCADAGALEATVEPPLPEHAAVVEDARARLARARSERHAGRYAAALRAVEEAKDMLVTVEYGPAHAERALEQGWVLDALGQYDAAEEALTEALELALRSELRHTSANATALLMLVVGARQERVEEGLRYWPFVRQWLGSDRLQLAQAQTYYAGVLRKAGDLDAAESEFRAALASRQAVLTAEHPAVAASRSNLGGILESRGRLEEAEAEYRGALDALEGALGPDHPTTASVRGNLGLNLRMQGKLDEAEAVLRATLVSQQRVLGADHPLVATTRYNLVGALTDQGELEEAEAQARVVLASRLEVLGPNSSGVAMTRHSLGIIFLSRGNLEAAEAEVRAALTGFEGSLGPTHIHTATAQSTLGAILIKRGKLEEAEAELRASLATHSEALGPDHSAVAVSRINLGEILMLQGKHEDAERELGAALRAVEEELGPDHLYTAAARSSLAEVHAAQGRLEQAEQELRMVLRSSETTLGTTHADVASLQVRLASVLIARGRNTEALQLAERSWQHFQPDDTASELRARSAFVLARVLWSIEGPLRDRARARRLAEDAARSYRGTEGEHADELQDVQRWRATHAAS